MCFIKKLSALSLLTLSSTLFVTQVFADVPDVYQNSGSNNIAYELPSKFYIGINLDLSNFTDSTINFGGLSNTVDSQAFGIGITGGYQINPYISVEVSLRRLGKLNTNSSAGPFPLMYKTRINNISFDAVLTYPLIRKDDYTVSVYGKGGYGLNFTRYNYNINNGSLIRSGNINHGAANGGIGVKVDLQTNISARIGYTYFQVRYPLPGNLSHQGDHVFGLDLMYNFA